MTVSLMIHFARSMIVSAGREMPSLETMAYLPSGEIRTLSGSGPTERLLPVGATFQPFDSRTDPSDSLPGTERFCGGVVCARATAQSEQSTRSVTDTPPRVSLRIVAGRTI